MIRIVSSPPFRLNRFPSDTLKTALYFGSVPPPTETPKKSVWQALTIIANGLLTFVNQPTYTPEQESRIADILNNSQLTSEERDSKIRAVKAESVNYVTP
jgi:hypothetical protein